MLDIPKQQNVPPMPKKLGCEHKWVFQGSDYEKRERNRYENIYKKIDTYYCEKCLEIKEIISKDENSEKKPYWYKG